MPLDDEYRRKELGWAPYVWLGYLAFYIAALFLPPATPRQWAVSIVGLAAFLPLYLYGFRRRGRRLLIITWIIFALGVAVTPFNSRAAAFFIYALAFLPVTGRTPLACGGLLVSLLGVSALGCWNRAP